MPRVEASVALTAEWTTRWLQWKPGRDRDTSGSFVARQGAAMSSQSRPFCADWGAREPFPCIRRMDAHTVKTVTHRSRVSLATSNVLNETMHVRLGAKCLMVSAQLA